jgi:hypothetical protein
VTGNTIYPKYCEDSDYGINFSVLGYVEYQDTKEDDFPVYYYDGCDYLGRSLVEYSCNRYNKVVTTYLPCKNGCVDRHCMEDNASEKCYLKLEINEVNTGYGINYLLKSMQPLYGAYVVGDYSLDGGYLSLLTKDKFGKVLNRYSLESSRFILFDNLNAEGMIGGGIIELNNGTIEIVIPFDYDIMNFSINESGILTNLGMKGIPKCIRTCKSQGEIGNFSIDSCCAELMPMQRTVDASTFVCSNCGDRVCSEYENKYSCPEDC